MFNQLFNQLFKRFNPHAYAWDQLVQEMGWIRQNIELNIEQINENAAWRKLDVALNDTIKMLREDLGTADRTNQKAHEVMDLIGRAAALNIKASKSPSRPKKSLKPKRRSR